MSAGADQVQASDLMGKTVYGAEQESIGEISDLILQKDGDSRVALIDVGGFLGVGERSAAVEPGSLTIQKQADGSERALVHATKEKLEKAPALQRKARAR